MLKDGGAEVNKANKVREGVYMYIMLFQLCVYAFLCNTMSQRYASYPSPVLSHELCAVYLDCLLYMCMLV